MTLPSAISLDGPPSGARRPARDHRIDVWRGLSLLCVFFDHIPGNAFSALTLGSLGFFDAADCFVFISGYTAVLAYGAVFERRGPQGMLARLVARCATIYFAHVLLLVITLYVLGLRASVFGLQPTLLAPIMRDGADGVLRVLALRALPPYLDVLPLYLLLFVMFPLVHLGLRAGVAGTVLVSFAVYALANAAHLNLPNAVDTLAPTTWLFNPFAWQFLFVLGAAFAQLRRAGHPLFTQPSEMLRGLCCFALIGSFLVVQGRLLWPEFSLAVPVALFGNDPKSFVSPWRILDTAALAYLVLTSARASRLAALPLLRPLEACGRHSLVVFGACSVLSLFGRIAFRDVGHGPAVQLAIDGLGLAFLLWLGLAMEWRAQAHGFKARGTRPDAAAPRVEPEGGAYGPVLA